MTDPKVWIRATMRPDGYDYYEMILVYVYDIIIFSHLCDEVERQIGDFCRIKEGIQGLPKRYPWAYT